MRIAKVNDQTFLEIILIEKKALDVLRNGRYCGREKEGREIQEERGIAHDEGKKIKEEG